mmetsp:Transcript_21695/g.88475  ORF Transcript_21695/g.88475 Transcript_21695/m.88475 type:complete len:89 (-) Transcript_21695:4-270(-)
MWVHMCHYLLTASEHHSKILGSDSEEEKEWWLETFPTGQTDYLKIYLKRFRFSLSTQALYQQQSTRKPSVPSSATGISSFQLSCRQIH